ncbi:type IV pilus assembly protein FimV [Piscinibacter gummiphilus]|uniref:Uncharacterized protein n=1 Tax=Piscinibacter gummiphilus TaxID=946333 RepID=A0A1W6L925_9BURK|nr:hypothetical protein [Piscinibacter gummiphilus]ARN20829.1 hypothetical protein A4W93_13500 [Piscinibacter gummiphilus]ATU65507.1 hypothetical protein CPZ87_13575 [Piscinibacter gummiphilus]GLS94664.1 hypothetical protein GCM10007918_19560 [Piscinibacter gummiphilus]
MQRPPILSPLVLALSLHAGQAMALGFGKVSGTTALGHPLNFAVGLRLEGDETLDAGCVTAEVMVGDRPLPADVVRARVVRSGQGGERRIRVTTTLPIEEPIVSVTVRAGCPERLSRAFVVFADPPHTVPRLVDNETDIADGSEVRGQSPFAAAASPVPRPARPATSGASEPRRGSAASVQASAPARRARGAAANKSSRPVLQLDPAEDSPYTEPTLRMTTTLGSLPAASGVGGAPLPDPDDIRRQQDQARLQALEASVRQLREDGIARERALTALQQQAREMAAERYANPLVYTLAGLCALLGLGLVAALWLRRRDRAEAAWWAAAGHEVVAEARSVLGSDTGNEPPPTTRPAAIPVAAAEPAPRPPAAPAERPAPVPAPEPDSTEVYAVRRDVAGEPAVAEPRRPMSAEELIDLEQQVEFFVVLGQDDAAIDLLMGHVRSTSGVSPLPYLKLLEIYRRREEREPYERIRERFNRRFNAYAPEWGVDPETGYDLEGYPEVLGRLQGIWQMPSMAMELLDTQLFRRDAGPTFDVPAYRELLFLYGIARDLAERDLPSSGVDLLLPIGEDEHPTGAGPIVALSPEAIAEPVSESEHFQLDLDVSTDQPPSLTVELPPESERGQPLDFHLDDPVPPRRR